MNIRSLIVCSTLIILFGCSSTSIACNDSETKDMVLEIATEKLHQSFIWINSSYNKPEYTDLKDVITTEESEKAKTCKANLEKSFGDQAKEEIPINYTIEITDEGKKIITIYGI